MQEKPPQETEKDKKTEEKPQEGTAEKEPKDENNEDSSTLKEKVMRSEIDIVAPISAHQQNTSDLTHYIPAQSVEPILSGPDEHIILIETNATANSKGVMILLPDWQQSATSPKAINFLRTELPKQGWTTIAIQPLNKPENYPSTYANDDERIKNNREVLDEYQQELAKILAVIYEKAKMYPGIIVVVSEGSNAALLNSIYQKKLLEEPMALISLSAHLDDEESIEQSALHLSQIELPVLDLFLKTDNRRIKQNLKQRKKMVNQELKSDYRQKQLFNIHTSYYPEETLIKEITGWLKYIGW